MKQTNSRLTIDGADDFGGFGASVQAAMDAIEDRLDEVTGLLSATEDADDIDVNDIVATGTLKLGSNTTDVATVKGVYVNPAVLAVAVPSITDPDLAQVDIDVSGAFSVAPAVGDAVIAIPQEALPTAARILGAWVSATDHVIVTFGSEGGNVTGANKNFKFLLIDLT
jgi:hypothetical protein